MTSLKKYNILYINLDKRRDRKKNIESQLKKLKLWKRQNKITKRIKGVDGQLLKNNSYCSKIAKEFNVKINQMKPEFWLNRSNFKTMSMDETKILGRVGCYLGHLRAIIYALKNNLKNVIILEDDCIFIQGINYKFEKPPKNADMFYLGGLFWNLTKKGLYSTDKNWIYIDPYKFKMVCALAYGLISQRNVKNIYNLLTAVWNEGTSIDKPICWYKGNEKIRATSLDFMYINFVQFYGKTYVINPCICVQSDSFISDVTNFGEITPSSPYSQKYYYNKKQLKEMKKLINSNVNL